MQLVVLEDDGEDERIDEEDAEFLELRSSMIEIAQDRSMPLEKRLSCILQEMDLPDMDLRTPDRIEFLLGLERLDEAWADVLEMQESASSIPSSSEGMDNALEQLLVYLLFRHLYGALEDGDLRGRIAFVCFIWQLLKDLFSACKDMAGMIEIARMYSSEIEYSDENIGRILDYLHERFPEL